MNLDDVVTMLETRPEMLVLDRFVSEAQDFINGFLLAKATNGGLTLGETRFKTQFHEWIREKYQCPLHQSWSSILSFYEGDQRRALEKFVRLYREFNAETRG